MAFDGIVTCAVAQELKSILLLGKIEKVYQPESDELVFHIHTRKGNRRLYASASSNHARIHLIEENPPNPPAPLPFCMLLRKYLQGGRITDIAQKDSERIIEMTLETIDELGFSVNKKLIFEIMGKHSNIILVDLNSGKIMDSIKRVSIDVNRARQILPGKIYEYPPAQDKVPFKEITRSQTEALEKQPKALLAAIGGISPAVAQVLADSPDVYTRLEEIRESLNQCRLTPRVYLKEDKSPGDFHVIPLAVYPQNLDFDTVSQALDYYFIHKQSSNRVKQKATDLSKALAASLDKLYLKRQRLGEDLLKAENSEKYRLYGELLTANIHLVRPGEKSVTVTNYYDGSQADIPLDPKYTPAKNAQRYFKKYGKAKTAVKEKKIQMEETDQDIAYLESVAAFLENASTVDEVDSIREELVESGVLRKRKSSGPARKKGKAQPFQYVTEDGFRVLAGHNNKENDLLTFKMAGPRDYWFHTKDIPGSHVIVFTEDRQLSETAIFDAASIAAYHSKGRSSENVPVDYTQARYVKKPAGAKPGMVIFTHNRTVYVTPKVPESTESPSR
ncbi:NFACT family protein [Anaerovorax odorimutans]|uniref:Rqc2 homolog RqcH n=1 Tax=Anaerovorax odorimutans TaxID=109327 RepID=A0ABT1RRR5_9FIRM|nr:NFACT RNA binding domain-containing protein [Anaerovorax odorimutans]MCQ4637894.1 NFACT family protein [Anaerovorax odorimutans]